MREINRMNYINIDSQGENAIKEDQDGSTEPPWQFSCLTPKVGELIYDYLIGDLAKNAARTFENHLVLCLHCQAELTTFKSIFGAWKKNPQRYFRKQSKNVICSENEMDAKE